MSDLPFQPADAIEPAQLHAAFAQAFSDYVVPFKLSTEQFAGFLARHCVDLSRSRVAMLDDDVSALALTAPRPATNAWRLATMGAVPAARGSGLAAALLDDFMARAGQAGMRWVELECFAQNERALRLYRSRGFEALHELRGYTRAGGVALDIPGDEDAGVSGMELEDAFDALQAQVSRLGDIPLQVTPQSLRSVDGRLQAWRHGPAQLFFVENSAAESIGVQCLVDPGPAQRDAQALVSQLVRRYPGHKITVPQLQRPDLGGDAFERAGFARMPLHGLLMRASTR